MGVLYENTLLGGSTWAGFSPTANAVVQCTGTFALSTPSALLITKAYLIAGCCGIPAAPLNVILNNGSTSQILTFSASTRASAFFQTAFQNNTGLSSVHAIDVTSLISLTATNYTLTIPSGQQDTVQRYTDFALAVEYFTGAGETTTQWFLNENNILSSNTRTLNFVDPIDDTKPVGMGLMTGYICNNSADRETVIVNGTTLGTIGSTTGDGLCNGAGFISPLGNYRYANQILTAGANCNNNQAVSGLDALSNIQVPVVAGTTYTLQFNAFSAGNATNNLWAVATAYVNSTPTYECTMCSLVPPTISGITSSGATVNWCAQGGIINWDNEVQWRAGGQTVWLTASVNNVSTYTIGGLISNTFYEYRVVNIDTDGAVCQPTAIQRFKTS